MEARYDTRKLLALTANASRMTPVLQSALEEKYGKYLRISLALAQRLSGVHESRAMMGAERVAWRLGVSVKHVYRLIQRKQNPLRARKVGRYWRIDPIDLDHFMEVSGE